MIKRLAVVLLLGGYLLACGGNDNDLTPGARFAKAGAKCVSESRGQKAVIEDGGFVICDTSSDDTVLRWRLENQ